jgi:archaellum biogenesis ATPase FlaH
VDWNQLLGGGLDRGSSTLLIGPAGAGKSALATQVVVTAASRGERVSMYLFDEGLGTFHRRAQGLGADVDRHVKSGLVSLTMIDPAELSPGEFADRIRGEVDRDHVSVVVIDSLNGYLNAMPEERFLRRLNCMSSSCSCASASVKNVVTTITPAIIAVLFMNFSVRDLSVTTGGVILTGGLSGDQVNISDPPDPAPFIPTGVEPSAFLRVFGIGLWL